MGVITHDTMQIIMTSENVIMIRSIPLADGNMGKILFRTSPKAGYPFVYIGLSISSINDTLKDAFRDLTKEGYTELDAMKLYRDTLQELKHDRTINPALKENLMFNCEW